MYNIIQGLTGTCLYFLRLSTEKQLTPNGIAMDTIFGKMECGAGKLLEGISEGMSKVMIPALKAQEVRNTTIQCIIILAPG